MSFDPPFRLREIPWPALERIADPVVEAASEVLGGQPAERVLDRLLRAHRSWSAEERRVAAEALFGVGLWRRRLAHEAGLPDWTPGRARALVAALATRLGGADVTLGVDLPVDLEPAPDLATRHSLPDWIVDLARDVFGAQAEAFLASLNVPGPITLRANTLRTSRDSLRERLRTEGILTEPGRWSQTALHVLGRANILGSGAHQEGWFEVQDEGSQLLGELVEARPGEAVLDLCAGAGGKTLQLAAQMEDRGTLYAFDVDRERLRRLERRAARAGLTCVRILWDGVPESLRVDRLLVDAPCSELGVLRRGPDVRWRLSPEIVAKSAQLQAELLATAFRHVRPGGRVVYATCSFTREENEAVVAASGRTALPLSPSPWVNDSGFLRTAPHLHGTDAFFAAAFAA